MKPLPLPWDVCDVNCAGCPTKHCPARTEHYDGVDTRSSYTIDITSSSIRVSAYLLTV